MMVTLYLFGCWARVAAQDWRPCQSDTRWRLGASENSHHSCSTPTDNDNFFLTRTIFVIPQESFRRHGYNYRISCWGLKSDWALAVNSSSSCSSVLNGSRRCGGRGVKDMVKYFAIFCPLVHFSSHVLSSSIWGMMMK